MDCRRNADPRPRPAAHSEEQELPAQRQRADPLPARDRRVVAVKDAWPGNRNDNVVFRETLQKTLPDHPRLSGDGGYRGRDRIRTPRRGLDGRLIKDRTYRRFRKRRAVAEHTTARLKDHQILRQRRRRSEAVNHAVAGVAALHNLKIDIP
ncbi:transposase family protein [Streptomyces sp. NPDC005708]|uniref:transposase family protein n=1 Tax=Streptomyces sp. NPDC005708 TaxID=3154564 RepID=UPI0033F73FA4